MTLLFEPICIGALQIPNRIMRSATAEKMADPQTGVPLPPLGDLYRVLAEGGVGLIVTGHSYIERQGKAHAEMTSIAEDCTISAWREVIRPAQAVGARVMIQINHAGANVDPAITPHPVSPSGIPTNSLVAPQALSEEEILRIVRAFGRAAERAREAGFDGVQIHGAHGYLHTQFLSPATNLRTDGWGGDAEGRCAFLAAVIAEVRRRVGQNYPLWIKLGVAGLRKHGLTIAEGVRVAKFCADAGVDCVEISHGLGVPEELDTSEEAAYLPMAQAVREAVGTDYPLALVNGFRTREGMERVLAGGAAQLISLCRPLIAEPDLPRKLRNGLTHEVACVRCNRCWPRNPGEGIACHNLRLRERLGLPTSS